jgi:hypothetical protein
MSIMALEIEETEIEDGDRGDGEDGGNGKQHRGTEEQRLRYFVALC